jgi:hypothetical protein
MLKILFTFARKQTTLMRRSTVLSLSLQQAFPAPAIETQRVKCLTKAAKNHIGIAKIIPGNPISIQPNTLLMIVLYKT